MKPAGVDVEGGFLYFDDSDGDRAGNGPSFPAQASI